MVYFQLFMMILSIAMAYAYRKKPAKYSPYEANSWSSQTIQGEDRPIEHCLGIVPVEGNVFNPWTEIANHLDIKTGLGYMTPLEIQEIEWPADPDWYVRYVDESVSTLNVCVVFGDGPNVGLVAGATLNDKLLSTWSGVTTTERLGTDVQSGIGEPDRFEIPLQEVVAAGESTTITMPDKDYANCAIIIGSPEGMFGLTGGGNYTQNGFGLKLEIREVGGAWHIVYDAYIWAKINAPVAWVFYADELYPSGAAPAFIVTQGLQHEWRVTRTEHPNDACSASKVIGKLTILGLQEIFATESARPGLHYLSIKAIASDALNGNLRLRAVMQGKILESIAGGTFAFSRNPAVAMKWAWTRPVLAGDGDGTPYSVDYYRGYDPADLVTADFSEYEAWCDEMVPDGKGGTEPRFQFDGRFIEPEEAWVQAMRIAAMSHAVTGIDGMRVRVYVDKVCPPAHVFCDGNMIGGSFREVPVDNLAMPGAIKTTIVNADAGYVKQTIQIVDPLATTDRTATIEGFGHNSISQVIRWARRFFDRGRYHDLDFTWRTGPCGLDAKKGETAYVQSDHNGRCQGGRVVESAEALHVTINHDVVLVPGTTYRFILQTIDDDGKHVTNYKVASLDDARTVVVSHYLDTATGEDVALSGDLLYTPVKNDVWIYGAEANIQMARITGQSPDGHGDVAFTAERYCEEYYAHDDDAPDYDTLVCLEDMKAGRHRFDPVSRAELLTMYPAAKVDNADETLNPTAAGIVFAGDAVDTISWTCTGLSDLGWIRYAGLEYWIQPDETGTTDTYIYFDPAAVDPTVLQHTDDLDDLRGQERFLACVNIAGVAIPQNWQRIGVNDTSLDWSMVVDDGGKPDDNADVTADQPIEAFRETFENPHDDLATRWPNLYTSGAEYAVSSADPPGGVAGGKFLAVGDNSGNDEVWLVYYKSIPFDPSKLYRMRVRAQTLSGGDLLFAGVAGRNAADDAWVGIDGTDSYQNQHYIVGYALSVPGGGWTTYTGYFQGTAATGDNTAHASPEDPGKLHEGVRYCRPVICCHYGDVAGIMAIDEIVIDIMPENADEIPEGSANKWAAEHGADVTANNPIAMFHEYFEDPGNDVATRWPNLYGGSPEISIQSGGAAGGKFVRIGNNSGNDQAWLAYYKSIPFDPSKLYRVRIRIRQTAGSGVCLLGVAGRNAADDAWVAIDGTDSYQNQHYIAGYSVTPDATWTVYTGFFRGTAATGDNTSHASPGDPGKLHTNVRYFRPMVCVNYTNEAGTVEIDEVTVDFIPEDADQIAESVTNFWAAEHGADITEDHEAATAASLANHDADSLAESATNFWAAEHGADITGDHVAASISGQGDLATIDEVDTEQVATDAITQLISVEDSSLYALRESSSSPAKYGQRMIVDATAEFVSTGAPVVVNLMGSLFTPFTAATAVWTEIFHRRSDDISVSVAAITLSGSDPVSIRTSTDHGLLTNEYIWITGLVGGVPLNGAIYQVTKVDDDEFTLQQTDSSLFTAYTSGGTIRKVSSVITIPLTVCADTTYPLFGASCIHSSLTDGKTYQFLATIRIWSSSEGGNHEHSALTILEVKR